jgi:dihydrofolate reductase
MRKLVAFDHVTLDGFASSGQGMGIEWTHRAYSEEFAAYGQEHIQADFDMAVYGRATYLSMYEYWASQPTVESTAHERAHAEWINALDKVVCSTTLESAGWNNTQLIKGNLTEEFTALKAKPGGTIAVYASPKLVHSLIELNLVDEFRLVVHPVVIGSGTPLFPEKATLDLNLLESKSFTSGAVYLRYQVG